MVQMCVDKSCHEPDTKLMNPIFQAFLYSWHILEAASLYLLFGFVIAGIIRVYINTNSVVNYLQRGKIRSVIYASLFGIPIPLCSCGVVPAVAGLRRQGANKGACLAFLTSTPETGMDSIALTYSLLGPILTLMRPITAFVSAVCGGLIENFAGVSYSESRDIVVDRVCVVDGCCDGMDCDPKVHARHHSLLERFWAGIKFAFIDLMDDLAVWFVIGIAIAGIISALLPDSLVAATMGSGFTSYLIAMVISGPMYVCATLSTPVAAALVMKGMSPGAALVMLMVGPATNIPTIAMVGGLLGKRALTIYLGSVLAVSIAMAYVTDAIYKAFAVSPKVYLGSAGENIWLGDLEFVAAIILSALIIGTLWRKHLRHYVHELFGKNEESVRHAHTCSCSNTCCNSVEQKSDS